MSQTAIPPFSVCVAIPAYNVSHFIVQTMESLVGQTELPDQVVVVNDGSVDDTGRILDEYAAKHPFMRVFHTENHGPGQARNLAFSHVRTSHVLFLDGDDMLAPSAVWRLKKALRAHPGADFIQLNAHYWDKGVISPIPDYEEVCSREQTVTWREWPGLVKCLTVTRKLFAVDFWKKHTLASPAGVTIAEDHYVALPALAAAKNIVLLPDPLYLYRKDNPASSTAKATLSQYSDLFHVLSFLINTIEDEALSSLYVERFISHDVAGTGLKRLHQLDPHERRQGLEILADIVNLIPSRCLDAISGTIFRSTLSALRQRQYRKAKALIWYKRILYRHVCKITRLPITMTSRIYSFFSIVPMRKNSVVYLYEGRYRSEYMMELLSLLRLKGFSVRVMGKTFSAAGLLRTIRLLARTRIVLLDSHPHSMSGVSPRKGQYILQLWHAGGAFKKFGLSMPTTSEDIDLAVRHARDRYTTHIVSSSEKVNAIYARAFGKDETQALALGCLKTDFLYRARAGEAALRADFAERFPALNGKKLLLFAPTFRNDFFKQHRCNTQRPLSAKLLRFDFDAFERRFGGKYVLGIRTHPNATYDLPRGRPGVVDVSREKEAEILACADALITDYSSLIFDYAFFARPMFFYAWDLDEYQKTRSFYAPYESFVPGPVCVTQEELFDRLETLPEGNPAAQALWREYMSACDGHVGEKIAGWLQEKTGASYA